MHELFIELCSAGFKRFEALYIIAVWAANARSTPDDTPPPP